MKKREMKNSPSSRARPPQPPYKFTGVIAQSPVDSVISLESAKSRYYAHQCAHWKILSTLLLLTIASGLLILFSARGQPPGPSPQNQNRSSNESPGPPPPPVDPAEHRSGAQISEIVVLYKLPPPLDQDASSEVPRTHHRFKTNDNSRHHYYNTGVFRPRGSRLWDPHPQYIFHAFGKRFHVVLNQISAKHSLLVPGFKVTTHRSGVGSESWVTRERVSEHEFNGCFYNGYVLGDLNSRVAVSLCSGMTGHIRTSSGSYFIQPRHFQGNELEHEIYIMTAQNQDDGTEDGEMELVEQRTYKTTPAPSKNLRITTTYDYYSDEDYDSTEEDQSSEEAHVRAKRSLSTERYVELTVVTDQTMSRYHGDNLKHYVLTLLSIVALVYRDASIGNPVNIVLVNFHVLTDTDFSGGAPSTNSSAHGTSASEMLRNFCRWQKEHNHPDDRHALHHDTALLLTRETICRNPWVGKCDTLGLAELGTMCDHYASCAIVQDNGLSAAFTIAHELGHVMNMPHDDDYKCQAFVDKAGEVDEGEGEDRRGAVQHYVMSRMLDHNTYPWAWSRCSRHFLTEFLDAGHGYCLEDKPDSNLLYNDDENSVDDSSPGAFSTNGIQQPGEVFSEHKQCEFVFGPNAQLCSYMPPCRRLWCTNHGGPESEESEGCRTQHMPWADGTRCGANKWCQRGACVLKDLEKLKVINGGWGDWQDYGECSRSCGGGVRKSYRECDNPKPKNGGKYCVGPRVRYESCNTFDCPGNATDDFRAAQCATYNGDNFNIYGLPEDVVWVPKYNGISPKDRCKLFCRVEASSSYYQLKEKVIDGTPCGIDTFDVCVNGACLPAGCDRRLHSTKTLDICGVCGGDGSTCTTFQGSYNKTVYGYSTVVRIPAGASKIDVRQRSYTNSARDDNYLCIYDPVAGEYKLNGNFLVTIFPKTLQVGGTVIDYSGGNQVVERLNSSSRPLLRDLEIRVLSVQELHPPDIVYQYVISSDQGSETPVEDSYTYEWVGKRGQNEQSCSSVCSGVTVPYKSWECMRRSRNGNSVVEATYCGNAQKPPHQPQACNSHCRIAYRLSCPESCVHARNYTSECVRNLLSTNTTTKISDKYCVNGGVEKPEPPDCVTECRNRKAKWRYTQWSECSAGSAGRCGGGNGTGTQIRNVWCQRFNWRSLFHPGVDNFEVVDDKECEGEKPIGRRNCRVSGANGGICGEWKIDQWSPCSTTCGPGRSRALYACVLKTPSQTQILPRDYCVHAVKPVVERPCEVIPCGSYSTGEWSECDCTASVETRNVTCLINGNPSEVGDCERIGTAKPEITRACVTLRDCEAFEYSVGNWTTDCRLFNGKHYRYRAVSCEKGRCSGVKPESMRECGEWKVESGWTGCNGSCSVGVEVRGVGCHVGGVKVTGDFDCEGIVGVVKPLSERMCFHNCGAGGASRMLRNGVDGVGGGVSSGGDRYWYNVNGGGGGGRVDKTVYRWTAGSFNQCTRMTTPKSSSSSCAPLSSAQRQFRKQRQVKCVAETTQPRRVTTVSPSQCTGPAPESSVNCTDSELTTLQPCPVWLTSEWSSCTVAVNSEENCANGTASILHGVKTREVVCVHDTTNRTVESRECEGGVPRPESLEKCVVRGSSSRACNVSYSWKLGNWTACLVDGKKKCGVATGRKVRSIECLRKWGSRVLPVGDEYCVGKRKGRRGKGAGGSKPRTERECTRPCSVGKERGRGLKWVVAEWSNCSRPCGGYGLRSRRVTCHRNNPFDWTDPDPLPTQIPSQNNSNYCPPPKPKEYDYCMVSETCEAGNGTTYAWAHTDYSDCSCPDARNATGPSLSFQKRKVYCVDKGSGQKTPARHCSASPKPKRKRKCECHAYGSCAEMRVALQERLEEVRDGEYLLSVGGKHGVRVYCHGMTDLAGVPKEYLGVNEETNWSEIYDKRLIRPETCPRNGSRLSSCECVNDRNRRVGLTRWRRVRLNVTNLRVDVDDFTFASSSQDLIPYGTAGDCYSSSMSCPQGRFSIDLRSTGFAVSSLSSWSSTGHRATMRVVRKNYGVREGAGVSQLVQGKCGGYCGTCGVSAAVGLRVDVV